MRIYCAGKISKGDWRHYLTDVGGGNKEWKERDAHASEQPFVYTGPYFVGDDHGCAHDKKMHAVMPGDNSCWGDYSGKVEIYSKHGGDVTITEDIDVTRASTFRKCLNAIENSDVVYAWLDCLTCFGTLWELGYSAGRGKRIVIGLPDGADMDEIWFSVYGANTVLRGKDAVSVLNLFLRCQS